MNWMVRFLRFFFRQLYHSLAWSYGLVSGVVSFGQWNQWVKSVAPLLKQGKVLELGFGPGHLQVELASRHQNVMGVDESMHMAIQSRSRLNMHGHLYRLTRARAENLPFPAATFDQVVSTFPTEYIFQADTLQEVARVLNSSGALTVLISVWITGKNPVQRLLAWVYHLTGQAAPSDEIRHRIRDHFQAAGFQSDFLWEDYPGARLLIIQAHKIESSATLPK